MSKACHKRELEPILPAEGVAFWRADSYKVSGAWIEATPEAAWKRATPAAFYKPSGKTREVEAGPHLNLLKLKGLLAASPHLFDKAVVVFVERFGLLGMMHEDLLLPPILPAGKLYVSPEAVVERSGELRQVDTQEGTELLLDLLSRQLPNWRPEKRRTVLRKIALPSEVTLLRRVYHGPWRDSYRLERESVVWQEAREPYGGLLLLDGSTSTKVSVLSTRESLADWQLVLEDFPSGKFVPGDWRLRGYLNARLTGISPYMPESGDEVRRGWRCSSLLQAIHLMLWLDLTGGRSVRKCGLSDCHNYFREGSQSGTLYCSPEHASLASTRMNRLTKGG